VILGMIAGAIGWNVMGQLKDASIKTASNDVRAIAQAIDMYQIKNSKLPDSMDALVPNELREIRKDREAKLAA
jgi:type II secretory pathway pseudopilin PulG